jgi:hypothetical protein
MPSRIGEARSQDQPVGRGRCSFVLPRCGQASWGRKRSMTAIHYELATFLTLFGGPAAQVVQNPVRIAVQASPWWTLGFVVLAVVGFVAQYRSTHDFETNIYNRYMELMGDRPATEPAAGA